MRALLVGLAVLLAPVLVHADTIQVTGGTLDLTRGGANFARAEMTLYGERGFSMVGASWDGVGFTIPPLSQCSACSPGTALTLYAIAFGMDLHNNGIALDGTFYPDVGGLNDPSSVCVQFFGSAIAPPLNGSAMAMIVAPFTFAGLFRLAPDIYTPSLNGQLVGAGQATLWLSRWETWDHEGWQVDRVHYEFEPVTEPASLLLLGTGLAGAALAWRRRRH